MDAVGRAAATPRPQSPNTREAYLDDDTEGEVALGQDPPLARNSSSVSSLDEHPPFGGY